MMSLMMSLMMSYTISFANFFHGKVFLLYDTLGADRGGGGAVD